MENHPCYIDPDDAIAGRWMFMLSRMRLGYQLSRSNFAFDYSHLEPEQKKYDITTGIGKDAHFAPDYQIGLDLGWGGLLEKVRNARLGFVNAEAQRRRDDENAVAAKGNPVVLVDHAKENSASLRLCVENNKTENLSYAIELLDAEEQAILGVTAKAEGIHVAVDTCGFAPWAYFKRIMPTVDLFLYDLKCIDVARHSELTGADNAMILDNVRRLDSAGAKVWIRCPLVPRLNDADSDMAALRDFVGTLGNVDKVETCPYHTLGLEKYSKFGRQIPPAAPKRPASPEDIRRWRLIPWGCATSAWAS